MYAYSELYFADAQDVLGTMLEYAVYDLKMEADDIYKAFLDSGLAKRFGAGEPKFTVGMSGIELAGEVIRRTTGKYADVEASYRFDRSPEYWAGWAIAYYEWYRNVSFERIERYVPIQEIVNMYSPFHEADISKFVIEIDNRLESRTSGSQLARLRAYAGLTQTMLAEQSGVSVRMIEQYEQGKKKLEHAQADTVVKLAHVLRCDAEDLI